MKTTIGIDPGLTGAISLFDGDKIVKVWDMPVTPKTHGKGDEVNVYLLSDLIDEVIELATEKPACHIEQVAAMPGQGVTSMFGFGRSLGVLEGVIAGKGLSISYVRPAMWKRQFGLISKPKDASRTKAISMFPDLSNDLRLKKHNGRADSMLIAATVLS